MGRIKHDLLTALGVVAAMTAGGGAAAAQDFTLTLHHFLGPQSFTHADMLAPWSRRIEAASGGRVKIEIYPSMSLGGTPPQLIRQVRDGVVDMIWTVNGYTPGLFPRTEVFELPFVHTNDAVATNLAMAELFDQYLAPEYEGLKVLFIHVHAGQAIQMVDQEVRSPADLEGLKIRIPTRTGAWALEALGASPVSMPVPDLPQALSRKVVDGALIPFEIIPTLGLQDLTQYQIEGPDAIRLGTTTFQLSMNIDVWNSLPADLQQVFLDNSGADWLREMGALWTAAEDIGLDVALAAGNTHIQLSEDEIAVFREALEPVVERWIAEVESQGVDGRALVAAAREAIARNAQ